MIKLMTIFWSLSMAVVLAGCSLSPSQNGALIGGGVGGVTGGLVTGGTGTLTGVAVGSAVGAGAGYTVGKFVEKKGAPIGDQTCPLPNVTPIPPVTIKRLTAVEK